MTTYNPNIPQPSDALSVSQGQLLGNFDQLNTQFAVDHTAFNTGSGNGNGFHKQVTLATENVPSAPVNPKSIIYTDVGTASTNAQLFWRNADSKFHISPIRAWATFNGLTGTVIANQSYNVTSITHPAAGKYVITLTAKAVSSTVVDTAQYGVLCSGQTNSAFGTAGFVGVDALSFTTATGVAVFQINIRATSGGGTDLNPVTFMVLQI